MNIYEKIKLAIKVNYSSKPEVDMITQIILKLDRHEYIPKDLLKKSIIDYVKLAESIINNSLELALKSHINSEVQSDIIKAFETGIDEVNEMMDKENYPK